MGILDNFLNNFQQLIGVREDEPDTIVGDVINTNTLSNNDAKVLSNSINNIYNNIGATGSVEISFEKVEGDSGIEFDSRSTYADTIRSNIDTSILSNLEGAYKINISQKPASDNPEAYYARTFKQQDPTLTVEELNREAKAQVTLDGLIAQGIPEIDARDLVIEAFNPNDSTLDNIGQGISAGFQGGLVSSAASISSLTSRILPGQPFKSFSEELYKDAARLSVTDGGLASNIGLGVGFAGTFLAGGAAGKGAGLLAKGLVKTATPRTIQNIATKSGQAAITGLVLPNSLEFNILQKLDRGEDVGSTDIANVILDVAGLSVNKAIRQLSIDSPLKKLYNQNPLKANLAETLVFEAATWRFNPDLTWQQQVGNLISGLAFNVATTTGINTQQIRELYEFIPAAEIALRNPEFSNPIDAIKTLDGDYTIGGAKPSEVFKNVLEQGEKGFATPVQIDVIRALNDGYTTPEVQRRLQIESENNTLQNNIGVNNFLRDSVSQVGKLTTIREALQATPRLDTETIRASSISAQRVNQIAQRIDTISPDTLESRKIELEIEKESLKKEQQKEVNKEISSINRKLKEVKDLRKELRQIESETIKPNTDLEVSVINDIIEPEVINLVEEGTLSLDNLASAVVNKRLGGVDIITQQNRAFEEGRGNKFIAANETLYNKIPIKDEDGKVIAYDFTPRINSLTDSKPIRINTEAYNNAKKQNTRAQKLEYTKMFRDIKASLRGKFNEIRKLAREIAQLELKGVKDEKTIANLTRKISQAEEKKEIRRVHKNIVSAWVNDVAVKMGRDNGGVNRIKQLLKSESFNDIDTPEGLQKWFDKAVKKLSKEDEKNSKAAESSIIKVNKDYHKLRKTRIKQLLIAQDKKDKDVIRKLGKISDTERQRVNTIYSNYIDARQRVLKSSLPILEQYTELADARKKLDNEIASFKDAKKLASLDREVRNKELEDEIFEKMSKSKIGGATSKLAFSLSKGLSVINKLGEGGRILAGTIAGVADKNIKRDDEYFNNKVLLHKALAENNMGWNDFLAYAYYTRSQRIRKKPLKDGTDASERENFNNAILEDGTSQNNIFIDRDGKYQFTQDFTADEVRKAQRAGWRPANEADMDKLVLKFNDARAKDTKSDGLNAVIEDLIRLNRKNGEEIQLLKFEKDSVIHPLEDDYLLPRLWIHTREKDIIDNNRELNLETFSKQQIDNLNIQEAKQQTGQFVINPDEGAYDRHHTNANFVITHFDVFGKVIPSLATRLDFQRTKQGKFLRDYAQNVIKRQRMNKDGWEKLVLQGFQLGVIARLGLSPTQLVTQRFIYLSLPFTNPDIAKEILRNKSPFAKNFSTDEISRLVPAYQERIRSQSSATSNFDKIFTHTPQTRFSKVLETGKEFAMSFTSSADAKVAADVAQGALFKNARQVFKKYGIPYSQNNVIDFFRGEKDFGMTTEQTRAIRDTLGELSSADITDVMVSNTNINTSTFEVNHPLLSAIEFFLGRSSLGEATRVADMWNTISKSNNPAKKIIGATLASGAIMTAAGVSKELSLGYAIMGNEVAKEVNDDDEIDLPDSSILIKESIAASIIMHSITDDEADRAAIRDRITASAILRSTLKETVGVLPFTDIVLPSPGFGDNIPQSISNAITFAIDAEDEVSVGTQLLTTAAILAPAILKPETQIWKQEARNQREFNKDQRDRRHEGKSAQTYEVWRNDKLRKEREKLIKEQEQAQLAELDIYIVDNPIKYLQETSALFPTKTYKEINRAAADYIIKNEMLGINPQTGTILDDIFLRTYVAYSKEGNRKDSTIENQLKKYLVPEDDNVSQTPQVYFETHIQNLSFEKAVTRIVKDYEAGLISESKAEDYITYAQRVWFKD